MASLKRLTGPMLGLSLCLLSPAISRGNFIYSFVGTVPSGTLGYPSTYSWSADVGSSLLTTGTGPTHQYLITSFVSQSITGALVNNGCTEVAYAYIYNPAAINPTVSPGIQTNFVNCIGLNGISTPQSPSGAGFVAPGLYSFGYGTLTISQTPEPKSACLR